MGQMIFDTDGTFTVPAGITEVNVCMVGGGGSGSMGHEGGSLLAGGGFSGQIISELQVVTPLDVLTVTVGVGGAPVSNTDGLNGTPSSIGTATAIGGGGGTSGLGYDGIGASRTTCGGTASDGTYQTDEEFGITSYGFGGQSSGFGKGGNGKNAAGGTPESGGVGAGGGAGWHYEVLSGAGGNGRVVVNWNDFIEDGGLQINGTTIPELVADGGMQFYCNDHLGVPYVGPVHSVVIDGTEVWREI